MSSAPPPGSRGCTSAAPPPWATWAVGSARTWSDPTAPAAAARQSARRKTNRRPALPPSRGWACASGSGPAGVTESRRAGTARRG
eukprot:558635-Prorocentrum_minimum.AAC.1